MYDLETERLSKTSNAQRGIKGTIEGSSDVPRKPADWMQHPSSSYVWLDYKHFYIGLCTCIEFYHIAY